MKVDLTKPIRCCDGRPANYLRDTPDGKRIIEWRSLSGGCWYVDVYLDSDVDAEYENVPSPPRKVTVAVVWSGLGSNTTPCTVLLDDVESLKRLGCHITEHEIEEPTP